ncbi:MAG: SCO family protein [Acidimicrobiia bacterium]
MRRWRVLPFAALAVCTASLGLAACGGGGSDAPSSLQGVVRKPALQVGTVTLPDESPTAAGAPFAMKAAPGGLLLVYFGYTNCPDVCPTTLSDIGQALRKLPAGDRDKVEVAFATIDPDRDSGEKLASYLDHFVDGGHALRTTDTTMLQNAEAAFNVTAKKVPEGTSYSMDHTAITFVVDDTGKVVVEWPFGTDAKTMAGDLQLLLSRGTT